MTDPAEAPFRRTVCRQLAAALLAAAALGAAAQDRQRSAGPASAARDGTASPASRAHVHGAARLTVALDAQALTLRLEAPLEGLLGFEHRPRTEAQRSAVARLQARLRSAEGLFSFAPGAACRLMAGEARSAVFDAGLAISVPSSGRDDHGDLDATFEFRCDRPEAIDSIGIGLFDAYPRLRRLSVEGATDKGQWKRELRPPARTVALPR